MEAVIHARLEAAGASVVQAYPRLKSVPSVPWLRRRWAHEEGGQGREERAYAGQDCRAGMLDQKMMMWRTCVVGTQVGERFAR